MDERLGDLLTELRRHRERYTQFCRSLSEDELNRPVPDTAWTVKGYIAHLATIDSATNPWFRSLLGEKSENAPRIKDIDSWNEGEVAARADMTTDDLLAEMQRNREECESILERFGPEQLDGTMHFGGDRNRAAADVNVYQYLRAWILHDVAHTLDMLRALPERREELQDWLGSVSFANLDPSIVPPERTPQ